MLGALKIGTRSFLSIIPLTLCTAAWGAETPDAALSIEPSVAAVVDQIPAIPVERALARVRYTSVALPSGVTTVGDSTYELLPNGLWGVTTLAKINGAQSRERVLSLCGLQELVGTREGKVDVNATVVAPVGKVFLPLSIATTHEVGQTTRTLRLKLMPSAAAVCQPAEGSSFEYETDSELVFRSQGGLFSSNRTMTLTHSWKCSVGRREHRDGSSEVPDAEVVPVTCEGTNSMSKAVATARWAYLPESALYLRLGAVGEKVSSKYEYQSLEPAAR